MQYPHIEKGIFISRPNRFIAHVEIDGAVQVCHVKNTGRCRELLIPGATVILAKSDNPMRKTAYDLIAVYKGDMLINMDSQAPNKVFYEWAAKTDFFGKLTKIQPETTYHHSRFDCYLETERHKIFVEVKGVTLEKDGVVLFPDAPTERGVKHLHELISAVQDGYAAYLFFVIQMENCLYFTPNRETHAAFADALVEAEKNGVHIVAVNCDVTENSLAVRDFVKCEISPKFCHFT